jgi:hypothetical protein
MKMGFVAVFVMYILILLNGFNSSYISSTAMSVSWACLLYEARTVILLHTKRRGNFSVREEMVERGGKGNEGKGEL